MDSELIDLRTLAHRIGLAPRTLRTWISDPTRPLPAYRVGGKLLFRWSEVERWVQAFRVQVIDADALAIAVLEGKDTHRAQR